MEESAALSSFGLLWVNHTLIGFNLLWVSSDQVRLSLGPFQILAVE